MLLTHTSRHRGDLQPGRAVGDWTRPTRPGIHRALGAWVNVPARSCSTTRTSTSSWSERSSRRSPPASGPMFPPMLGPLACRTRYLPRRKRVGRTGSSGRRSLSATTRRGRAAVRRVPGSTQLARIAPTALRQRQRDRPGPESPTSTTCCGEPCMTRRHDAWAAWPEAPGVLDGRRHGLVRQALLDRLARPPEPLPADGSTVAMMTTPAAGRALPPGNIRTANDATRRAIQNNSATGFAARTELSGNRGTRPARSRLGYRHAPFQAARDAVPHRQFQPAIPVSRGTSLWLDPGSDTYIPVLANVIHQRGGPPIATRALARVAR